jgi:hypothetical protein
VKKRCEEEEEEEEEQERADCRCPEFYRPGKKLNWKPIFKGLVFCFNGLNSEMAYPIL